MRAKSSKQRCPALCIFFSLFLFVPWWSCMTNENSALKIKLFLFVIMLDCLSLTEKGGGQLVQGRLLSQEPAWCQVNI